MDEVAFALLDYMCKSVSYRSDNGEFWFFPDEVIRRRAGDCDDSAILLCSLLRNFYPADRVYVVAGIYRGLGHAWVELDGEVLEPTYTYAHPVPDPWNYKKLVAFNDQEVFEMWPGALGRLFQLAKNECKKLALMAEAQRE